MNQPTKSDRDINREIAQRYFPLDTYVLRYADDLSQADGY